MQSEVLGWVVCDHCRLFEARTDGFSLLDGANQQGGDRWMLVAHVSGPLRLQPELYAQTARGGVVVLARKPGVGRLVTVPIRWKFGFAVCASSFRMLSVKLDDRTSIDWQLVMSHQIIFRWQLTSCQPMLVVRYHPLKTTQGHRKWHLPLACDFILLIHSNCAFISTASETIGEFC